MPANRPWPRTAVAAQPPVLGARQAAVMLGLTYEQMKTRLEKGVYPARKVGRNWEILRADVERLVSAGSAEPTAPAVELPELLRRLLSGEQVRLELRIRLAPDGGALEVSAIA